MTTLLTVTRTPAILSSPTPRSSVSLNRVVRIPMTSYVFSGWIGAHLFNSQNLISHLYYFIRLLTTQSMGLVFFGSVVYISPVYPQSSWTIAPIELLKRFCYRVYYMCMCMHKLNFDDILFLEYWVESIFGAYRVSSLV
jgi:hypothetical protein